MRPETRAAAEIARQAGTLLRQNFGQGRSVQHKGPIDLVTDMDRAAEQLIVAGLDAAFPSLAVVSEESASTAMRTRPHWLIDPLDGTTNYARGYPLFAVSIALVEDSQPTAGVVYNPVIDELFLAEAGQGATLNGKPLRVSATASLAESLLASGFPYDAWSNPENNTREWAAFVRRVLSLRCDGSAALDLCHVAAGRLDGYWELDLESWDMAAGAIIVAEAGGQVSQADGRPFDPLARNVLASNGRVHAEILALLRENRQGDSEHR